LLDASWRVLAPGGKLLYATCSVFPKRTASRCAASSPGSRGPGFCHSRAFPDGRQPHGQILPGASSDGFYYALLTKPAGDG